jgi:hypothetical protein
MSAMTKTAAKAAIVGVFLLLLILPGLQMLTHAIAIPPLDENRTPAPAPTLAMLANPADFTAKLQAWFNDHYGFREILIRTKTQIDYSLFRMSDRLHIGRGGWLYYRSVIDTQEPQMETLADRDLDDVLATFARLRDWLAPRGIKLIVQTQQLKDKFYPEYLPREAQFARRRHRFDDFRTKLAALPGITYLDTTPPLLALKARRQVFHKTDFHWNDPAAFDTAARLVDTIATLDGRPVPFWKHTLHIAERPFSGGQANFMPLFRPPSEIALFVEPDWDESAFPRDYKSPPFEWKAAAAHPDPATRLPTTVIFGDSFTDGMTRAGLVPHFDQIMYARLYRVEFADVLRAMPKDTKYLVVEFIETALPSWIAMKLPD